MAQPAAVRKHDGRIAAFDADRLAESVARALYDASECESFAGSRALASELAHAAGEFLVREYPQTPSSADIRELAGRLLRETGHERAAEAYAEHSRATASFLWRLRVSEVPGSEGTPWDRRRLIESLRASGVARDPAGEVAREIERKLVDLLDDRLTPALIHALTICELQNRGIDSRRYAARRIAASFSAHAPRYDAASNGIAPLPTGGAALLAFWLQSVHSPEVATAVYANTLGLDPCPCDPSDVPAWPGAHTALDPLHADAAARLAGWPAAGRIPLLLRCDGPERAAAAAKLLSTLPGAPAPSPERLTRPEADAAPQIALLLKLPAANSFQRPRRAAAPITLNIGGLVARSCQRDIQKIMPRLTQAVTLAAQAHREREEFWGLSPVRGRELPVVAAGIWNAAAWLAGEAYDKPAFSANVRLAASTLCSALAGAIATLRQETGLQLTLVSDAPKHAARSLWRGDREHFAQDGVSLDANGGYAVGLELKAAGSAADLGERLEFLRSVAGFFDEPPAMRIEAPVGMEQDADAWRELLGTLVQSGMTRAQLVSGGSTRSIRLLSRLIRGYLEGFPLFERL